MDDKFEDAKEKLQVEPNEEIIDEMPIIGSILAIIALFLGLYTGFVYNIGYLSLSIGIALFCVMISFAIGWNSVFMRDDYAPAVPIIHLAIGSLLEFVLIAHTVLQLQPTLSIFVVGGISMTVALFYQYLLLKLIFINWDRSKVEVEEHPKQDNETVYVFKEEVYIPLLEKSALEKQSKES